MTQPLAWSAPRATGWATIEARDDTTTWRITPVPGDVTRIHYAGVDPDGTIVASGEHCAYAETVAEAHIVVGILRAGTDALADWRDQLLAAGLVQSYPDDETLAGLWHDDRRSGLFQISVKDGFVYDGGGTETSVSATYESGTASFWHNVSHVACGGEPRTMGGKPCRDGLPHHVDALKAGVAAALAIRQARIDRGGAFAIPLGGLTKKR